MAISISYLYLTLQYSVVFRNTTMASHMHLHIANYSGSVKLNLTNDNGTKVN